MCLDFITTPFEPQRHKHTICGSLLLPVQYSPWPSRSHCLPLEHNLTIDDHFCKPFGILMRVFERGRIANSCWIKHNDVRSHPRPYQATIEQPEALRRK